MNDLRTGFWSDSGSVINEPGNSRLRGRVGLGTEIHHRPQGKPSNRINDCRVVD